MKPLTERLIVWNTGKGYYDKDVKEAVRKLKYALVKVASMNGWNAWGMLEMKIDEIFGNFGDVKDIDIEVIDNIYKKAMADNMHKTEEQK